MTLAFENVGLGVHSIYTEEEFINALDGIDPIVGYLIDVGHAHANGWDLPGLIESVSHRLLGLHIHDNDGKGDDHLPIYHGSLLWHELFEALRPYAEDCELILEYAPATPLDELV